MVEETQDVKQESTEAEYEPKDLLPDEGEPETPEESSTEEQESQEPSGEDENADAEVEASDNLDDEEEVAEGQSIPYERFKKHREQYKKTLGETESLKSELKEKDELLKNPDVYRSALKSKGLTEEAIENQMASAGFKSKVDVSREQLFGQFREGLNLDTQEGWMEMNWRMAQSAAGQATAPIQDKLTRADTTKLIAEYEVEAKKLAKDAYGLDYGTPGVDERNQSTAIGKMMAYLDKNPNHAGLGHPTVLKLAMSEEGFKGAIGKGVEKEKKRQVDLKRSQMEGDSQSIKGEEPDASWDVDRLMEYSRKHNK